MWRARSTVINALALRLPFWLPASVRADWIITRSESPIQKWYVTQPCRKPLPPSYMSCPYTVDAALREKPDARPRDAGMHDSGPLRRTQVIDICHIGARCEAFVERDMAGFFQRRRRDEASRLDSALLTKDGYVAQAPLSVRQTHPGPGARKFPRTSVGRLLPRTTSSDSFFSLTQWVARVLQMGWLAG